MFQESVRYDGAHYLCAGFFKADTSIVAEVLRDSLAFIEDVKFSHVPSCEVCCCQNSWTVSTTNSSALFGRFFSMSVVSWDTLGALSLFIDAMVFLISFFLSWGCS